MENIMNEFDSPNFAEYVYPVKSEGKVKMKRMLMVALYVSFILGAFILCVITKLIPLFAIGPLCTFILYLCTWRLVKYDIYWRFNGGMLELGRIKDKKSTGRLKVPFVSVHVKDCLDIAPLTDKSVLDGITEIHDYSESQLSDKRIYLIFEKDGARCAAIIEGTEKIGKLLTSFCPNAHDLRGNAFHG